VCRKTFEPPSPKRRSKCIGRCASSSENTVATKLMKNRSRKYEKIVLLFVLRKLVNKIKVFSFPDDFLHRTRPSSNGGYIYTHRSASIESFFSVSRPTAALHVFSLPYLYKYILGFFSWLLDHVKNVYYYYYYYRNDRVHDMYDVVVINVDGNIHGRTNKTPFSAHGHAKIPYTK